jgi:hypothetical protein
LAPKTGGKSPHNLDAWGEVRFEIRHGESNEPDEAVLLTQLGGIESEPMLLKVSVNAIGERIALGPGKASGHKFHHPGIGIHERERDHVGLLPQPQRQARSLDYGLRHGSIILDEGIAI